MVFCSLIDGLYSWIPVRRVRAWLIRVHMEGCPACQARLVSRVEAMRLFVRSEDLAADESLWINIRNQAGVEGEGERAGLSAARRRWQWAVGTVALLFGIVVSFWLLRGIEKAGPWSGYLQAADRFEVEYLTVAGEPADPYIYQPKDSDMIFVWAEKINSGRNR